MSIGCTLMILVGQLGLSSRLLADIHRITLCPYVFMLQVCRKDELRIFYLYEQPIQP